MIGYFINNRPIINLTIGNNHLVPCLVDTGFSGDLILSEEHIKKANLTRIGNKIVTLADGSTTSLPAFLCEVNWFNEIIQIEVLGVKGKENLLGMCLLLQTKIEIEPLNELVQITKFGKQ